MKSTLTLLTAGFVLAGCATMGGDGGAKAVARLAPTKGNMTDGTIFFEQKGDVVRVSGTVTGLKPNSEHGFHVHEKGDCSSGDGMSAGGHFNPLGKPHGLHSGMERHAGDMPNLRADAYGNATFSVDMKGLAIGSGATDIVGKGLIVHRDPDDYKSQPVGNAGPRLACAVIAKS
jgi:superoxide dismutase, Cu-Zn family